MESLFSIDKRSLEILASCAAWIIVMKFNVLLRWKGFFFFFGLVLLFCFEHYVNGKIFILYSFRDLNANEKEKAVASFSK